MTRQEQLNALACTDGGCCIRKPSGMHTNGGCRCPEHGFNVRVALAIYRKMFDSLSPELKAELLAEVE